jgi:hypothetical protein
MPAAILLATGISRPPPVSVCPRSVCQWRPCVMPSSASQKACASGSFFFSQRSNLSIPAMSRGLAPATPASVAFDMIWMPSHGGFRPSITRDGLVLSSHSSLRWNAPEGFVAFSKMSPISDG